MGQARARALRPAFGDPPAARRRGARAFTGQSRSRSGRHAGEPPGPPRRSSTRDRHAPMPTPSRGHRSCCRPDERERFTNRTGGLLREWLDDAGSQRGAADSEEPEREASDHGERRRRAATAARTGGEISAQTGSIDALRLRDPRTRPSEHAATTTCGRAWRTAGPPPTARPHRREVHRNARCHARAPSVRASRLRN